MVKNNHRYDVRMRITIVGCGSIGRTLAEAADCMDEVKRIYLVDLKKEKAEALAALLKKAIVVESVEDELYHCDLVVEAATQDAAKDVLMKASSRGVDTMITSVGALVDDDYRKAVFDKAKSCDARIYIPSGALFGMDGLRAASNDDLDKVELVLTAGDQTFVGVDLGDISERKTLFTGTAREAVKRFPKNVNIAATVSLLGVGFDKTVVTVIMDPHADTNRYDLIVEGRFGKSVCTTDNVYAPESPYNSYLAINFSGKTATPYSYSDSKHSFGKKNDAPT